MPTFEKILYEKISPDIVFIRINNPGNRNAIDVALRKELLAALAAADNDPQIRAVVLTGAGKNFCAGGDIKSMGDFSAQAARDRMKLAHKLIYQLQSMEIPVIAMVHGYAVGAGMNICLACDLVFASEDAIFCQSFARIGLIPDAGGLYFLPRLVGVHRAKELMFSARPIDAAEALRIGIINSVYPREALEGETLKMARSLAGGPRYAQGLIKRLMNQGLDASLPVFLEMEAAAQALCFNSPENREGVQAFLQKRSPQFQKPESRQHKEES